MMQFFHSKSYQQIPRIGVFDSGVGGLTILAGLRSVLPHAQFIYCCDEALFPYGDKSEIELDHRVAAVIAAMVAQFPLDLLVIACNTASTYVLPRLREEYAFPIVGVVPAIKTAVECSDKKVIGLLATRATIARAYTQELIAQLAPYHEVVKVGSPELVFAAEQKIYGEPVNKEVLKQVITPFLSRQDLDTVVLGCTHFPHFKFELAELAPHIRWIDSTEAIARRVVSLMKESNIEGFNGFPENFFLTTAPVVRAIPHLNDRFGLSVQRSLLVSRVSEPQS